MVGIIFAVLLAVGITYAGNSVLMSISAESREVYSDVATGNTTDPLNINATVVFPRAIVRDGYYFLMNVSFAIMLPANASYFSGRYVVAAFSPGPNPYYYYSKSVAEGEESFYSPTRIDVKGEPMGGTGIGFWNVTLWMIILHPPSQPAVDISQNQSWLSFTSQVETHLTMFMDGGGIMTATNGYNYSYQASASFNFQGNPATFYVFSYPVGAWLGYGASILIGVATLLFLIHENGRRYAETLRRWFPARKPSSSSRACRFWRVSDWHSFSTTLL